MKSIIKANNNGNFKFFMPLNITKGKDKDGNEVMKVGGIASTKDEDSDGESLDPKGFDLTPFKKTGLINWHHMQKSDPAAIIGEPTKAEVNNDGLYIEAELYKDSDLAKKVYTLAKVMAKNSDTRRLGFSIEGKVLEKDEKDENIIKRAAITGCAITYMPKNPSTFVDIIKGGASDSLAAEDEESYDNGGDTEYLLNMKTKDGGSVKISKKGEIIIDLSKSVSTEAGSGKALIKEEVDGKIKDVSKSITDTKELTKAQVYDRIFSDHSDIDLVKAEHIYNIITKITEMSKKAQPTKKEIEKAYAILNINKSVEDDDDILEKSDDDDEDVKAKSVKKAKVSKSDDDDDTTKKAVKKAKKANDEDEDEAMGKGEDDEDEDTTKKAVKKAKVSKSDDDDDDEAEKADDDDDTTKKAVKKAKVSKADDEDDDAEKAEDDEDDKEKGEDDEDAEKSVKKAIKKGHSFYVKKAGSPYYSKMIMKGDEAEEEKDAKYEKAENGKFSLVKAAAVEKAQISEQLKKFNKKQEDISKAVGDVFTQVLDRLDGFADRLDSIENQSNGRKSINKADVKVKERKFNDGSELEKGGEGNGDRVSINNRKLMLDVLEKATFAPINKGGSIDAGFEKALTVFESSGQIDKNTVSRLDKEYNIKITQ